MMTRIRVSGRVIAVGLVVAIHLFASSSNAAGLEASWNNGFHLKSEDGQFAATIGGRIMQDWVFIHESKEVPAAQHTQDGVEFRGARLYMAGTVYGAVEFKSQWDFAGGNVAPKDVYLGLKGVPGVGGLRIGNQFEPFSLDEVTSGKYITFMERGLTTVFAPGRNPGILAHRTVANGRATYALGLFRTDDDTGVSVGDAEYAQTARLTFLPVFDEDAGGLLHVGAAASHRTPPDDQTRFRFRPENHLGARVLDSGVISADDVLLLSGEVAAIVGAVSFQGEFVRASITGPDIEPTMKAYSASVSLFLTGEQRSYKTNTFSRTQVKQNFDPQSGGTGAWEVAARISKADLDDSDNGLSAGNMIDYTGAVNWYLNPATRVMLNFVFASIETPAWEGDVSTIQTRFQIDF